MIKTPEKLNNLRDVDVASPTNDYALVYDSVTGFWNAEQVDHGALAGLAADGHAAYHTNARGDIRYLYRENVVPFTPDADYEPSTKKYVDDLAGFNTFLKLLDTPDTYVGGGGKFVKIKADVSGLEFTSIPGGGDMLMSTYDPDEDGVIAIAQLDLDVALVSEIDDVPVDGEVAAPISSNWAFDHVAAADPHTGYMLESVLAEKGDILYASAASTLAALAHGTVGQVLASGGHAANPQWQTLAIASDFPQKMKPNLARWVIPGWYFCGLTTTGTAAGTIYYLPIFVSETTTYIRIAISIQTASAGGGAADLRIFNWSNGLPGTLVLSAGTVDTGSTGVKEIVISQELARGYYFLAIRCSASTTLHRPDVSYAVVCPVSGINTACAAATGVIMSVSAAYSDPAPAPTAILGAHYAFVYLREN